MVEFDAIDMDLLQLLVEDARRPYSDMADHVDLSAPAVRDRVNRLTEAGVIRRFTADIDRSLLDGGVPVIATIDAEPGALEAIHHDLMATDAVEHVYSTVDARVIAHLIVTDGEVRDVLIEAIDMTNVRSYEVDLLESVDWTPWMGETTVGLECAECGNTVTAEGESRRLDGTLYHFCCPSCTDRFVNRYTELREGA
jgi:DNA-binding Lrp family transcriptional regulator